MVVLPTPKSKSRLLIIPLSMFNVPASVSISVLLAIILSILVEPAPKSKSILFAIILAIYSLPEPLFISTSVNSMLLGKYNITFCLFFLINFTC